MIYNKHFVPLESNPTLFTELIHQLGFSTAFSFQDVLSTDDPDLLAIVPRPVLALVLVFPTTPAYEKRIVEEDSLAVEYDKSGEEEDVLWYKQTIDNACGLYGILHAISNGDARDFVMSDSHLARLLEKCAPLQTHDRARVLESNTELESIYTSVALRGDTAPPDPEDEVDFHYVCFVKSQKNGHLYELDGDRKGPIDKGALHPGEDMLSRGLELVRQYIQLEESMGFSLLALAPT